MTKKKDFKLERISFRVDPRLLNQFETHCETSCVTRSEALRTLFNENIYTLNKQQEHETPIH
jgi:metal-responsive CopG/Arc/MetJ family transcriptional regulator